MPTSDPYDRQGGNRLLDSLPPDFRARFMPRLTRIPLVVKQVAYEANQPIPAVYFPISGVVSLVTVSDEGVSIEVATVGNEGMVGIPLLLGAESTPGRAFVQIPGEALRMEAAEFRAQLQQDGLLRDHLGRYTQSLFNQIAQSAACNRLHSIDERCARWLLMTHDRVSSDQYPLTQEFLAQMLGVRRASVNAAASILQRAGYIRYSRGTITIVDRERLESASCECYRIIRDEYDRLLGPG